MQKCVGFLFFIWKYQIFCYITQYDQQKAAGGGMRNCNKNKFGNERYFAYLCSRNLKTKELWTKVILPSCRIKNITT